MTCLLSLSVCPLLMMSITKFNCPHRPGGGLDRRAFNLLQTSCKVHFSWK